MRSSEHCVALSVLLAVIALAAACSNDGKPNAPLPTSTEALSVAAPASAPSPSPWKSSQPQVFPWPPDIMTDSNGMTVFDIWVNTGGLGISGGEVTLNYSGSGCKIQEFSAGSLLGKNPLVGHKFIDNNAGYAVLALARIGPTRLPTNANAFGTVTMNCQPHTTIPILSLGLSAMMADDHFEKVPLVGNFAG
tara:strand:- start:263 stop:838 length:576 start_codon:yes stop_codon:yes gene_type:complete